MDKMVKGLSSMNMRVTHITLEPLHLRLCLVTSFKWYRTLVLKNFLKRNLGFFDFGNFEEPELSVI
jgi:hypothetical protein